MWFVFGCSGRPVQSKSAPNESSSPVADSRMSDRRYQIVAAKSRKTVKMTTANQRGTGRHQLVRSAGHSYYGTNMSIMADIYHVLHFPRPVNDSGWLERRSRDGPDLLGICNTRRRGGCVRRFDGGVDYREGANRVCFGSIRIDTRGGSMEAEWRGDVGRIGHPWDVIKLWLSRIADGPIHPT